MMVPYLKKTLLTLVFLLQTAFVFATDQISDLLICNGTTFYISGTFDEEFPLYPLLQNEAYKSKLEKHDKRASQSTVCYSTACYRGYQAIWELDNGILYLKAVLDGCTQDPIYDLEKIFGEKNVTTKGVRAFWVNKPISIASLPITVFTIGEDIRMTSLNIKHGKLYKKE